MRQTFLSGTEQQNHHQPIPTTQNPSDDGLIIGPLCLHGLFSIWETTVTLGVFTLQSHFPTPLLIPNGPKQHTTQPV